MLQVTNTEIVQGGKLPTDSGTTIAIEVEESNTSILFPMDKVTAGYSNQVYNNHI